MKPSKDPLPQFDVLVCIHNALPDVQRCLVSVINNSPQLKRLILVNDGSDAETRAWLEGFVCDQDACVLLHHEQAQGYTTSANRALHESDAPFAVLLNSDTEVSNHWLADLHECFSSDKRIGIVGPLSNAASWQSIPERWDTSGDWHLNPLPQGMDVDAMAACVKQVSQRKFPQVPFVNGFCFAISRRVIEQIGYFDAESFPQGYGEENDYCLRAAKVGFKLAIADQAYVYHAKSKSFSHERRKRLSTQGGKALQKKHGWFTIWRNVRQMRSNRALKEIGERLGKLLAETLP